MCFLKAVAGAVLVGALAPGAAAGQPRDEDAPLVAGRPGFTESPGTVGHAVLQFEGGPVVSFVRGDAARPRGFAVPDGLLRLGLGDRLELRLGGSSVIRESFTEGAGRVRLRGTDDLYVGGKTELAAEERSGFSLGIVTGLTLPTGSASFSSGSVDPGVTVAFGRALAGGLDVGASWGLTWTTDEDGRQHAGAASVSLGRELAHGVSIFGEVYRESRGSDGSPITAAGGVAALVHRDVQLDVQVGRHVRNGSAWMLTTGVVVRHRLAPR